MLRRLAFLCLAAALAGCATYDPARDTRGWFFNRDGEVKLAYGTPQSDDVPLMLSCQPGTGRVFLSQGGLRPGDGITLTSGSGRSTFYGMTEPDQLNGGLFVTAEASALNPVLTAFRDTGRITLDENGRPARLYATPAEHQQIRQFFSTCGYWNGPIRASVN